MTPRYRESLFVTRKKIYCLFLISQFLFTGSDNMALTSLLTNWKYYHRLWRRVKYSHIAPLVNAFKIKTISILVSEGNFLDALRGWRSKMTKAQNLTKWGRGGFIIVNQEYPKAFVSHRKPTMMLNAAVNYPDPLKNLITEKKIIGLNFAAKIFRISWFFFSFLSITKFRWPNIWAITISRCNEEIYSLI